MTSHDVLGSWRAGATRDAVVTFLDDVVAVRPEDRVACFVGKRVASVNQPRPIRVR